MAESWSSLSGDTAADVADWLTPRDLRHAALVRSRQLESPFYQLYVRHHLRLRMPLVDEECEAAINACTRARAGSRPLPTHVCVGLPSQLASVSAAFGPERVDSLEIDPSSFFICVDDPPSGAYDTWHDLSRFHHLVHLVIEAPWTMSTHLDVSVITRAVPMLETLSLAGFPLKHEDAFMGLKYLCFLDVNGPELSSLRCLASHPRLEHFRCFTRIPDADIMSFSQWRPLKILELMECSPLQFEFIQAIEQIHLPNLDKLYIIDPNVFSRSRQNSRQVNLAAQPSPRLVDLIIAPNVITNGISALSAMTQLRSLHLCWDDEYFINSIRDHGIEDASPLATLVHLETLKLRMGRRATTCQPLRALTRLRELHLVDGWLRDFVDCLPRLEKLSVEEFGEKPRRRTFQERHIAGNDAFDDSALCSRLREVLIGKSVVMSAFAWKLIQDVEFLSIVMEGVVWEDIFRVNQLEHLTSFEFMNKSDGLTTPSLWRGEPCVMANIHSLETLRLDFLRSLLVDLPWSLEGARRLRVISLNMVGQGVLETIARWSTSLVQLEEMHLARYEGHSLEPLLQLHTLRVIGIGRFIDCRQLRSAQGVGRALPHLTTILHDEVYCLCLAICPIVVREGLSMKNRPRC